MLRILFLTIDSRETASYHSIATYYIKKKNI